LDDSCRVGISASGLPEVAKVDGEEFATFAYVATADVIESEGDGRETSLFALLAATVSEPADDWLPCLDLLISGMVWAGDVDSIGNSL
jgi:hypothetical protein